MQCNHCDVFLNCFAEAVTGQSQVSYKAIMAGKVVCLGLPQGVTMKKPSAYSIDAMEAILNAQDSITFKGTFKY